MRYRNELRLDFDPGVLNGKSSVPGRQAPPAAKIPLRLTYSPSPSNTCSSPSPEKAFVLHALQGRITNVSHSSISPRRLLRDISNAWDAAIRLNDEIRILGYCGVTRSTTIKSQTGEPSLLRVRCILLGNTHKGSNPKQRVFDMNKARMDIDFMIKTRPLNEVSDPTVVNVDMNIDAFVGAVYGFSSRIGGKGILSDSQMSELLNAALHQNDGLNLESGTGAWCDAVHKLKEQVFG